MVPANGLELNLSLETMEENLIYAIYKIVKKSN